VYICIHIHVYMYVYTGDERTLTIDDPDLLVSMTRVINLGLLYKPRAGENLQVLGKCTCAHSLARLRARERGSSYCIIIYIIIQSCDFGLRSWRHSNPLHTRFTNCHVWHVTEYMLDVTSSSVRQGMY